MIMTENIAGKPVETSSLQQQQISENLKVASQDIGDIAGAATNEVIPFKRSLLDGTSLTNMFWENDDTYDKFSPEASAIYDLHPIDDRRLLNQAGSLAELNNTSVQIKSARKDAEVMTSEFGFIGSLGVYAVASLADPFTYTGYGFVKKVSNMVSIAEKLRTMSTLSRSAITAVAAAGIEGASEAQIQSTGAREYEQVAYTALFASVLGGSGYAISDMLSKSQVVNKQQAMETLSRGIVDPKLDPQKASELLSVFEADKIAPIRSTLLKGYDSTIGKLLNNKLTSSPMIEAWRKGGVISAIASRFDTNVGMSKDVAGNTIHNNSDTAFDVKYRLYEGFAKLEKSRLDSYGVHLVESQKAGIKPLTEQEYSRNTYKIISDMNNKYQQKKNDAYDKILLEEDTMSKIREDVVSKVDANDEVIAMPIEEQNKYRTEETRKAVMREAKERIKDTVYDEMENIEASTLNLIKAHNEYYGSFGKQLKETGIDVDGNFDSTFHMPRIYNQEAIAANPIDAKKAIEQSIRESVEHRRYIKELRDELTNLIQSRGGKDIDGMDRIDKLEADIAKMENEFDEYNVDKDNYGDTNRQVSKKEQELMDDFFRLNDTESLEKLHKYRTTQLKTKKTKLAKEKSKIEFEIKKEKEKLDPKIASLKGKLNNAIYDYPKASAEAMVDNILKNNNISEIDFDSLTPSRLSGRTMSINPSSKDMDLYMRTNEAEISQMYQYQTSGIIAVKHATGHTSYKDFIEELRVKEKEQASMDEARYQDELKTYSREMGLYIQKRIKDKPETPVRIERVKMDKQDYRIAQDLFELTKGTRQIPDNPNNFWEVAVRRVSQYNYITMGGQFAKYGLSEIGAGVYSTGFGYFKELVPALKTVIKMYRNEDLSKLENDGIRMIEGNEIWSHNTRAAVSDTEWIESTFAQGAERKLQKASEFMFRYSGLEAITALTKIALPRAFLGRIITQATQGKTYQPDLLRWGITPDDMIAISKENFILDANGKVEDFNFDKWNDQNLMTRFQRATTRMSRDTIMKQDATRLPVWMTNRSGIDGQSGTNPMFMLAKQFMSFTMLAHERLLLRGLNEKSAMAATGALTSAMLLATFAVIQEELSVASGYTDKKDRKFDITTKEGLYNLGKWTSTRHSFAGVVGMSGETLVSLLNPSYRSGEQALTKVVGGPTLSRVFGARNVGKELLDGKFGTQNQAYFTKSLLPANNMFVIGSIVEDNIINPLFGVK